MASLEFASIRDIRVFLERKEISVDELLDFYYGRFAKFDKKIGSALELFDKKSVKDRTRSETGLLAGIPGLIKDNICIQDRTLTCASKILAGYVAPYNATVIDKLSAQGAFFIGRANMDEFAMGSSTETSAYQKTVNPWNAQRVPGGSSGGSIAAVAAGLIPWALGSETGGSVRQPAALCGIVGSKPTYGLVSRYGLVAYASSIDQIGVATRTVYDNALVLSAIAGTDVKDATTLKNISAVDYTRNLTGKIKPGLKIGVIDNALHADGVDPEVAALLKNALKEFERLGAIVEYVKIPVMDYSAAVYFILSRAEAASNLARFDGVRYGARSADAHTLSDVYELSRSEGFGPEVQRRILIGNYVLSVGHADKFYNSARQVQHIMRAEFLKTFKEYDLLFAPVSPAEAFPFGAFANNSLQMDLQDYFTAAANLVGIPAVSIPCGFTSNKLPVGFQLMGPDLSEELIFQTGYAYEQVTQWHANHPEL